MQMLLIRDNLWKFVDPGTPPTDEGQLTLWNAEDQRARATIALHTDRNQQGLIENKATAKETWEVLKKISPQSHIDIEGDTTEKDLQYEFQ